MKTAEEYNNYAAQLSSQGNNADALENFRLALALNPNQQSILNNAAIALTNLSRPYEALAYLQRAMNIEPPSAETHFLIGNILHEHGFTAMAIGQLQTAVKIDPGHAGALTNLGLIFKNLNRISEAIKYFELACKADPEHVKAYAYLLHCKRFLGDWSGFTKMGQVLDKLEDRQISLGRMPVEEPFISVTRTDNSERNLAITKIWCQDMNERAERLKNTFSFDGRAKQKDKRIRVGYLSADFRDHATTHLILGLFRLHDRQKFQVYIYSYSDDDGSWYQVEIRKYSDKFTNLRSMSDLDCARTIYDDGIDILVDLKGHTGNNRLRICTYRPAPVLVTYLGFPGTTAAKFIDYMITDKVVTPKPLAKFFTEKLVYMPDCYQVNDDQQPIATKKTTRSDWGLPDKEFVFGYLGQSYKIEPRLFDVWMRLVKRVPKSVMWLMGDNETVKENLRLEAKKRGVEPDRLVFATRLAKPDHLARLALADLALDTLVVNGHTTTSDALWVGVPVVTLLGRHFASRVAGSLLRAVGLPELVANSLGEYETMALDLALNIGKLKFIRDKLAKNRTTYPLFDTQKFVKNLEKAYRGMWSKTGF